MVSIGKVYFPIVGLGMTLNTLEKRRDVAQRAVDAEIEANRLIASDKNQTVSVLTKDFNLKPEEASKAYDLAKPTCTANGRPSPKAVQFQLENDFKSMNLKQQLAEDRIYDYSLLPKG